MGKCAVTKTRGRTIRVDMERSSKCVLFIFCVFFSKCVLLKNNNNPPPPKKCAPQYDLICVKLKNRYKGIH